MDLASNVIPLPCQIRMARAALRWSIQELADRSNVSAKTIQRLERYTGPQASTVQTIENIVKAFTAAGIVLVVAGEDGLGAGVRLRNPKQRC